MESCEHSNYYGLFCAEKSRTGNDSHTSDIYLTKKTNARLCSAMYSAGEGSYTDLM